MKKQIKLVKTNFIKKIFIKICRILGYEIIDQNNLYLPTSNKYIGEELSKAGKKSRDPTNEEIQIRISELLKI